jgi:hypothetical protein
MGSKTTKTTSSGTATTTPTLFQPAVEPLNNYYSSVNDTLSKADPYSFVTPINDLQKAAFTGAASLGAPNAALTEAASMARNMIGAAAPSVSSVSAGTAKGYDIADLANAQGYDAVSSAPVNLNALAGQAQAQSMLDNLSAYYNPAAQAVVDTTLAGMDQNALRSRAAMEAEAAKAKAFGGSRYGLQVAQAATDMARERAATEAMLRAQAFNTAAGLSQYDTSNRQQAQLFNVGAQNARDETLAQFNMNNNQFNAGQQNQAAQFLAGANNQFGLSRFDAENSSRQFGANAQNQFSLADAQAANAAAQANAQLQMAQRNADLAAIGQFADISSQAQQDYMNQLNTQLGMGNTLYSLQDNYTQAPINYLQNYGSLLNPALIGTASGQTVNSNESGTETGSSGIFDTLLGGAFKLGAAAITKSERRVKRDITQVGALDDGLGVYRFRYIWDDDSAPLQTGVMVDEVEKLRPWALGPVVDGIQTVNYGEL